MSSPCFGCRRLASGKSAPTRESPFDIMLWPFVTSSSELAVGACARLPFVQNRGRLLGCASTSTRTNPDWNEPGESTFCVDAPQTMEVWS